MNQKTLFSFLAILALILIASPALADFDPPTCDPTANGGPQACNTAEPINIGDRPQTKRGRLELWGLNILGELLVNAGRPTQGQFLTADPVTGLARWATPSGGGPGGGDTLWGGSLTGSISNLNTGMVGIGRTPATGQIDVALTDGSGGRAAINALYPAGGNLSGTQFSALKHANGLWNAIYADGGSGGGRAFYTNRGNVVITNGRLGIGVTSPAAAIDVDGGIKANTVAIGTTNSEGYRFKVESVGGDVNNTVVYSRGKILADGPICSRVSGQEFCLTNFGTQGGGGGGTPTPPAPTNPEPNRFGGMYVKASAGFLTLCPTANPITGDCSCGSGFTDVKLSDQCVMWLGPACNTMGELHYCYK